MPSRATLRVSLAVLSAAAALVAIAGCTGSSGGDQPDPRCDETIVPYQGKATDEACKTMLSAEDAGQIMIGPAGGAYPVFTHPTNGETLAAASIGTALDVTYASTLGGMGLRPHRPRPVPMWQRVLDAVSPVSVAWAHLPPITGPLYMVRLYNLSGRTSPFLLFTTRLDALVTGSNLAFVKATTTTSVRVQITGAYLTENVILNPPTDGPFRPNKDLIFHVQ